MEFQCYFQPEQTEEMGLAIFTENCVEVVSEAVNFTAGMIFFMDLLIHLHCFENSSP